MANLTNPEKCIELKEDIFYLESGKHKHAGKRRIIGRVISETGYGFYNIEVLASDGPNALGKGIIIQRPAGNILSAQDCTDMIRKSEVFLGGKVIGHTSSGKHVYESSPASHSTYYGDFTAQDHTDAAHLNAQHSVKNPNSAKYADSHTRAYDRMKISGTHFKVGGHVEGVKDGKKIVMDSGNKGGMGVGAKHSSGGIDGEVGTEKHKINFEGGEIILTAPVAEDKTLYDFEGKKMTPRQIASKLNTDNGGVSFADGGELHSCKCTGRTYEYGGKTMCDTDIINDMNRKAQLQKGVQTETNDHRNTLERLNDGYITIDQALAEIAETHLKENPNYYTTTH